MRVITTDTKLFDYTDKILKIYIKKLLKIFKKTGTNLSQLRFDEINQISPTIYVNSGYDEVVRLTRECLVAIAKHSYSLVNDDGKELDDSWVYDYLATFNPVTKYIYDNEVDRKRSRYLESVLSVLLVAHPQSTIKKETDTATRLWVRQFEQYADNLTVQATIKAYEDYGIHLFRWHTQKDEKVCYACSRMDNEILDGEEVAQMLPAHFNCRCFAIPILSTKAKKIKF